jgi:hypothetical protein
MGLLGLLLNTISEFSVENWVLLYKQLLHPTMDYAYPVWRSVTRTHVLRLRVL